MAEIATGGGEGDAPPTVPHLDDGIVAEILHRLPTKDAYRCTAVCPAWRAIISEPAFLCRHLSPRPLPLVDEGPYALILQPRRKVGYTHLTVVPTDPDDRVVLNLPLDPKFTSKPVESRDVAKTSSLDQPAAAAADVEEYVEFLERTVPMLDISFVASHGRLLLGRSRSRYYVCDPAANRWLVLPPSSIPPTRDAARGFHYDLDAAAATGRVSFTVVLLVRARRRRVRVEAFSSATGRWETTVLAAPSVARRLGGVASPGIHVGASCFYWLCRRRGHVVRYDAARGRASVVREPPEAEGSKGRVWRSLGSAGGRLRLCAFDIRDEESGNMTPHEDVEGVHGVWVLDCDGAGAWRRVHEAVVDGIQTWYFHMLYDHEIALDYAGACSDYIVVDKENVLLRYDLESGDKVELASLCRADGKLGALYGRFQAFPFFRSA